MISFLPLCSHPNPKQVLIVGGGDGGVAREVVKHPAVEHVTQVEIDARVMQVPAQHGRRPLASQSRRWIQIHEGTQKSVRCHHN
ncbi:hypothetical protein LSTR_LSTR007623 [Laodelphax striatellus]|uniref:PABS domain-containing protein n=1 Tax=Laodelphax striatellus TaxID=195883 RepID=A0A482WIJ3_LAOST|nr:hypothetical protein LSTR_LSTR007623 [Laodelphax striatellus]